MADGGFPGQHSTTTISISNVRVHGDLPFEPLYIRTISGILKVTQVLLNLLGFICIICSQLSHIGKGTFFNLISMIGFWVTGILLAFYMFHVVEKFYNIPWLKAEFLFCALWTVMYMIAASVAASVDNDAFAAAAFFGFCAMVAYCVDAFFKFRAMRSGELPQGEHVVSKQTASAVSTPHY